MGTELREGFEKRNPTRYRKLELLEETRKDFSPQFCIYFGITILIINLITLFITIIGIEMTGLILVIGFSMVSIISILIGLIIGLIYRYSKKRKNSRNKSTFTSVYLLLGVAGIIANIIIPVLVIMSEALLQTK